MKSFPQPKHSRWYTGYNIQNGGEHNIWTMDNIISLVALIAFGGYFIFTAFKYLDMFLLIEYRQWIFHATQDPLIGPTPLAHLFDPQGDPGHFEIAFSRSLSLWTAGLFSRVCGPTIVCHNSLHLTLLIAAATLAASSVRTLSVSRSWFPAVLTWILIVLSIPVFDAITWQATLLDKLAAVFTTLTLLIGSRLNIGDKRLGHLMLANIVLLVTIFAAYNSKEAAFFLMPALVLLIAARSLAAGMALGAILRSTLSFTIAPIFYALLHVGLVLYNRIIVQPGEMRRVTGGDLLFNVEYYSRYVFDMLGTSVKDLEIVGVCLVALFLSAIVFNVLSGRWRDAPLLVWALLSFAGSLVIPLRTSSTAPFYLLVPLSYFGLLVGLTIDSILRFVGPRPRALLTFVCAVVLVARVIALQSAFPLYDHLHELSTNFQRTLAVVRANNEATMSDRILFVRPASEPRAYMYVSSPADAGDYALAPYLAPAGSSFADLERFDSGKIQDVPAVDADKAKRPGDFVVFLAPSLDVAHTERVPRQ